MEKSNSKILSFEEFLNQGAEVDTTMANDELPEIPAADGDPAGDAPVASDMELVDGTAAPIEGSEDGETATAEVPAEETNEEEEEPTADDHIA